MKFLLIFCVGWVFAPTSFAQEVNSDSSAQKVNSDSFAQEVNSDSSAQEVNSDSSAQEVDADSSISKEKLFQEIGATETGKLKSWGAGLKKMKKLGFIEIGRLELRPELAFFPSFINKEHWAYFGQVSLNFTRPIITSDGKLKWIIEGGLSAMRIPNRCSAPDEPDTPPFISGFFRPSPPEGGVNSPFYENHQKRLNKYNQRRAEHNKNLEEHEKKLGAYAKRDCPQYKLYTEGTSKSPPFDFYYLGAQTGLAYDLGWVEPSLVGGVFVSTRGVLGLTGRFSLGGDITHLIKWGAGLSVISYDEHLFYGVGVSLSVGLKSWFVRL